MAIPMCRLEGTWEEVISRAPDFDGKHLRVEVYSAEDTASDFNDNLTVNREYQSKLAAVLKDIVERSKFMNPKPDQRDYLREGRAGEMFGYDSAEELAKSSPTELLTFDTGQRNQAAALAPSITVNLLIP